METNKPKIFISSTIYDFYDLRSALKYYLESLGYEVLLSEYNDFQKELDLNSYEACLKSIENVNYFILLVGSRVGGYYDKSKGISITQKEYQKAYEQLKNGKLKIVNIVRENLWLARNERNKLEKILIDEYKLHYDITDKDIDKLKYYKSSIVNDAKFTFNFIDEIAKTDAMKNAQKGLNEFPKGNWIHTFKTYNDIVDILKIEFGLSKNIENLALLENLKYEILQNLKYFFIKVDGEINLKTNIANTIYKKYNDEIKGNIKGKSVFTKKEFAQLGFYIVACIGYSSNLSTNFLDYALQSGKFLIYDNQKNALKQSPFSIALLHLREYIKKLVGTETIDFFSVEKRIEYVDKFKEDDYCNISNLHLFSFLSIYKLQIDIVNISYFILLEVMGEFGLLDNYKYEPTGPSTIMNKLLEEEEISDFEIVNYIIKQFQKLSDKK